MKTMLGAYKFDRHSGELVDPVSYFFTPGHYYSGDEGSTASIVPDQSGYSDVRTKYDFASWDDFVAAVIAGGGTYQDAVNVLLSDWEFGAYGSAGAGLNADQSKAQMLEILTAVAKSAHLTLDDFWRANFNRRDTGKGWWGPIAMAQAVITAAGLNASDYIRQDVLQQQQNAIGVYGTKIQSTYGEGHGVNWGMAMVPFAFWLAPIALEALASGLAAEGGIAAGTVGAESGALATAALDTATETMIANGWESAMAQSALQNAALSAASGNTTAWASLVETVGPELTAQLVTDAVPLLSSAELPSIMQSLPKLPSDSVQRKIIETAGSQVLRLIAPQSTPQRLAPAPNQAQNIPSSDASAPDVWMLALAAFAAVTIVKGKRT